MTIPSQDFLVSSQVRIKISKTTLITLFLHRGCPASSSASSSFSLLRVSKRVLSSVLKSFSTKRKSRQSRKRSSTRTRRTVFFSKQSISSFTWTTTQFVHFSSEQQINLGNFWTTEKPICVISRLNPLRSSLSVIFHARQWKNTWTRWFKRSRRSETCQFDSEQLIFFMRCVIVQMRKESSKKC